MTRRNGSGGERPVLNQKPAIPGQFLERKDDQPRTTMGEAALPRPTGSGISKSELSQSLNELDQEQPPQPKRRFLRLTRRKVIFFFIALALIAGLYFGIKVFMTSGKLFSGNIFDLLGAGATLKTDEYGRSNILVFGTSEDDPGHEDAGANLTDSIMIISIDQKTKNAVMISVPRDLWVKYGEGCMSG